MFKEEPWPVMAFIIVFAIFIGMTGGDSASATSLLPDADSDGLPDSFEQYLASAGPDARAYPNNADSDGDGVPDGFEYCLTELPGTPTSVPTYEFAARVAAYQVDGENIARILFMMTPDPATYDQHEIAVASLDDGLTRVASTGLFPSMVTGIAFGSWGSHNLFTYEIQVPMADIRSSDGGLAFGVVGDVGGTQFGHQVSAFVADGELQVSSTPPTSAQLPPGGSGGSGGNVGQAEIRPGKAIPAGWVADEVCGATELREPTGTGLLRSVVQSIGCTAGNWACPAGVCSMSGPAGYDKPVIDVQALILPPGGS